VYGAACIMCHDDATPHIMTHDAALIVLTSLSHGTNFTFILSTLSLSLSLYYISSMFIFFFQEKKWWKMWKRRKKKE
jgi:hypothetical protein